MMTALEEFLHTLMIRKNLRNAHIINKSQIEHGHPHFYCVCPASPARQFSANYSAVVVQARDPHPTDHYQCR